ncbi:MAG TPA: antitoxin family protein [Dehalococcoidia bacterium]|nr:antitoxin family protein [Dehalococcoidia bacterium]
MTTPTPSSENMPKVVRAKYILGKLEPMENLDLSEGEEVTISVKRESQLPKERANRKDGFERAAGGWVGLVDTDELLRIVKESRKVISPPVEL